MTLALKMSSGVGIVVTLLTSLILAFGVVTRWKDFE